MTTGQSLRDNLSDEEYECVVNDGDGEDKVGRIRCEGCGWEV